MCLGFFSHDIRLSFVGLCREMAALLSKSCMSPYVAAYSLRAAGPSSLQMRQIPTGVLSVMLSDRSQALLNTRVFKYVHV